MSGMKDKKEEVWGHILYSLSVSFDLAVVILGGYGFYHPLAFYAELANFFFNIIKRNTEIFFAPVYRVYFLGFEGPMQR